MTLNAPPLLTYPVTAIDRFLALASFYLSLDDTMLSSDCGASVRAAAPERINCPASVLNYTVVHYHHQALQ